MANQGLLAIISALASFALTRNMPQLAVPGSAICIFLTLYIALASISRIYTVIIYPHFLSPLRKLPTPPVRPLLSTT
jgi:hypothetical protein